MKCLKSYLMESQCFWSIMMSPEISMDLSLCTKIDEIPKSLQYTFCLIKVGKGNICLESWSTCLFAITQEN